MAERYLAGEADLESLLAMLERFLERGQRNLDRLHEMGKNLAPEWQSDQHQMESLYEPWVAALNRMAGALHEEDEEGLRAAMADVEALARDIDEFVHSRPQPSPGAFAPELPPLEEAAQDDARGQLA
ncbi:MAG: hypothetical protein ACYCW6_21045 [Candidatus Xenobia bacterium]